MKKLISIIILSFMFIAGYSQSYVQTMKSSDNLTSDTITNTGTGYVQVQISATYSQVSIQAVVTSISGTVNSAVYLQTSVDGINYINYSSTDTLHTTTGTVTHTWVLTGNNYMYYRLTSTGRGTMAASIKGYAYPTGQVSKHATSIMKSDVNLNSDTVTNSGSGYVQLRVSNYYTTVTMQAVVTKLSGTAAGTVTVQGSNDNTNWETVNTSYITSQTLSVTNVTTSTKLFVVTGSPYAYYRLSYTGSGTMSCTLAGYLLPNKH